MEGKECHPRVSCFVKNRKTQHRFKSPKTPARNCSRHERCLESKAAGKQCNQKKCFRCAKHGNSGRPGRWFSQRVTCLPQPDKISNPSSAFPISSKRIVALLKQTDRISTDKANKRNLSRLCPQGGSRAFFGYTEAKPLNQSPEAHNPHLSQNSPSERHFHRVSAGTFVILSRSYPFVQPLSLPTPFHWGSGGKRKPRKRGRERKRETQEKGSGEKAETQVTKRLDNQFPTRMHSPQ